MDEGDGGPALEARHISPAVAGSYPARPGNRVWPLVDGVPAFRRIGEAIETARHSIWLTVAFYAHDFRFPDGRGGLFDALDRAVVRGIDVRILFWRPNAESKGYGRTFPGTRGDRDWLAARGCGASILWDRASGTHCQHQKSWLIDAGEATESAFVGGTNLTAAALGSPGHRDGGRHDLYVEIHGPSATDVHHNFVQRWNEASERKDEGGAWPHGTGASTLPFPTRVSPQRGPSVVQIQRMVGPGRYADGTTTPGGRPFDIAAGERSILEQYKGAIDAARSTIVIENQAIPIPEIADRLAAALERGVLVALLVPAAPEDHVRAARRNPARAAPFHALEALARHDGFLLAGLADRDGPTRRDIYVHSKAMLVDDAFATIGSCNLHSGSMSGHAEMNASIWDGDVVRALRCELFREHIGEDAGDLDGRSALRRFGEVARSNASVPRGNGSVPRGIAFALVAASYGL